MIYKCNNFYTNIMEFRLENRNNCRIMNIRLRVLLLFFDIFCVIYSNDQIEMNNLFIHYCITLFTIFLSIMNILRIECIYSTNSNRSFYSVEEYQSWKKENFMNTKFIFVVIENICKITFLYHSTPMEYNNLYTFSILILQISTILFLIMLVITLFYMICIYCSNPFLFNKSRRIIQPMFPIELPKAPEDTTIEIGCLYECSICMEVNNNQTMKTVCNHEFHEKCLFEWMKHSSTCPICRKEISNQLAAT